MREKYLKNYLFVSILILFSSLGTQAQSWIYFTGVVFDESTEMPVPDYPVFISENDSLTEYVIFTNQEGVYFDSVFTSQKGFVDGITVSTFDCEGMVHQVFFEDPDSINFADFQICVNWSGCEAMFFYETDFEDPFLLHFSDLSQGSINYWLWDFGDGTGSSEQNPSHQYNAPGTLEVCLQVQDTAGNCFDLYCEYIVVGDSNCKADFSWYPSQDDPMKIVFTDQSVGDVNIWLWDFGDNQFSEEQSPTHTYNSEGQYAVTLSIVDTMGLCFDVITKLIPVADSSNCSAYFVAELDTLNNTPNVYNFENRSLGNYDTWYWDFGDGHQSSDLNPTHVYQQAGEYDVCLFISSNDTGMCFDTYCETIQTLAYFNFGGHVFLDEFPLNIDENDSTNVAIAFLYRRVENQWQFMDSREFWKYGYYWFVDKPAGEYLIRADLMSNAVEFGNYSPSYSGDTRFWGAAQTFVLSDSTEFAIDIHLNPIANLETGIGSVSGSLEPGSDCAIGNTTQVQLVYLLNSDSQVVSYTYTNAFGKFSFDGLGFGTYQLRAEVTGRWSNGFNLSLNAENPSQENIHLDYLCNTFVDVKEIKPHENDFSLASVYPVPANEKVTVKLSSRISTNVSIQLVNTNGKIVFNNKETIFQGEQKLMIETGRFPNGIYLLRVLHQDGNQLETKKIIINR